MAPVMVFLNTHTHTHTHSSELKYTVVLIQNQFWHHSPFIVLYRHWGIQEVEAPRFQDHPHTKTVRLSALCTGRFYPKKYSWYSCLLKTDTWSYLEIRLQEEVTIQRLIINPSKGWSISNVSNNHSKLKILVMKWSWADWSQEMPALIWCRIFCLPVCHIKIKRLRYTELKFCLLFCIGVKLGRLKWGRNIGWGCLRIGCWDYLGLRGTKYQGSGENYKMRSIVIFTHQILFGW
jgi:hypothetical protein